ncbi:hypothetical protein BGZ76_006192, partial [Entomortierella beljakovae]
GQLSVPITYGSTLTITGTYLGAPVYTDNQSLCEILPFQGYFCPIAATTTSITREIRDALAKCQINNKSDNGANNRAFCQIPITLKIEMTNGGGSKILCQQANNIQFKDC